MPGIRAGKNTAEYIQKVLDRVNVAGAIYLSAVCILPSLMIDYLKVPQAIAITFGGTSLLILVGVALDTVQQIQSYIISQKYEGFMKAGKARTRRVQF